MATQDHNPFVLPGFGQAGDLASNPIMASMEMMRQAWQGLAATSGLEQAAMSAPMSVEDLDRRIADLRAVENWLRLNLSMLTSTIHGLEVQRSTISTLKSFMSSAAAAGEHADGRSPLEVVLGLHPEAASSGNAEKPGRSRKAASPDTDSAEQNREPSPAAAGPTGQDGQDSEAGQGPAAVAAQGWWDMLQQQFDTLAAATAATLQAGESADGGQAPGKRAAGKRVAPSQAAGKESTAKARTTAKAAAASPGKKPVRKSTRSAVAKKAAARKRSRRADD